MNALELDVAIRKAKGKPTACEKCGIGIEPFIGNYVNARGPCGHRLCDFCYYDQIRGKNPVDYQCPLCKEKKK